MSPRSGWGNHCEREGHGAKTDRLGLERGDVRGQGEVVAEGRQLLHQALGLDVEVDDVLAVRTDLEGVEQTAHGLTHLVGSGPRGEVRRVVGLADEVHVDDHRLLTVDRDGGEQVVRPRQDVVDADGVGALEHLRQLRLGGLVEVVVDDPAIDHGQLALDDDGEVAADRGTQAELSVVAEHELTVVEAADDLGPADLAGDDVLDAVAGEAADLGRDQVEEGQDLHDEPGAVDGVSLLLEVDEQATGHLVARHLDQLDVVGVDRETFAADDHVAGVELEGHVEGRLAVEQDQLLTDADGAGDEVDVGLGDGQLAVVLHVCGLQGRLPEKVSLSILSCESRLQVR